MKIGLVSDTHNFFDPKIPDLLRGVEHIFHAGDVGQQKILWQLEEIAPVTAVFGNTDCGLPLRETEIAELAGKKCLIHHIVDVRKPSEIFRRRFDSAKPDIVIFGHTHQPFLETISGALFVNPGSAGKARFNLPRTLAILHCEGKLRVEFKNLETGKPFLLTN